jgi:single-stranded-DNA-specific exonuclease
MEMFHRPVFVLSDEGEGQAQGSGRSLPSFHLLEALESMADLFTRFGGHRQAAGLTMPVERVGEFRRRMNEYAAARLAPEEMVATFEIDAELELSELSAESIAGILAMAPFGFGNPAPVFAARGVVVSEAPVVMKDKHLRLRFAQNGKSLTAKAWHFADRSVELARGAKVDILVSFEPDAYSASRGYANWSASLRDVRAAA